MRPNSKEFRDLQAVWDKRLAKSGFEDIEQRDGYLKKWEAYYTLVQYDATKVQAKTEYYRAAGKFLYDHVFTSKFDKAVWELHAEGLSVRNIVKTLKAKRFKAYKRKVHEVIQGLAKEMIAKCQTT